MTKVFMITVLDLGTWHLRKQFKKVKNIANKFKDLNQKYIFLYPGFNFRNNEIQAVIGQNQIKKLDINNKKRN